jgi:hypothetical protein
VADKQSQLILDALTRSAAEPSGLPLHASKFEPGLFPNTALGKAAAQRCQEEQMLQTITREAKGKPRETTTITEKGVQYLLETVSPKKVLEDFVRILEERREQVDDLLANVLRMAENLDGLKAAVSAVLPQVLAARISVPATRMTEPTPRMNGNLATMAPPRTATIAAVSAAILTHLSDWSASAEAGRDCPLADLFRAVACGHANLSLGLFHDSLRQLHDTGRVYLHPWTGPLYEVPEPMFALLVGHNIAYYASVK